LKTLLHYVLYSVVFQEDINATTHRSVKIVFI